MTTYKIEALSDEIRTIGVGEYRQFVFSFDGDIELTDTITTITGNDARGVSLGVVDLAGVLTIGTAAITTGSIIADRSTITTARAVTVFVSAPNGVVGTVYTLRCRAITATGQTVARLGWLRVE